MKIKQVIAMLFIVSLISFMACSSKGPESDSGDDQERHLAKEMPVGDWVIDKVSYKDGDRTDWKLFVLKESAEVKIEILFKNADAQILVELRNTVGKVIERRLKLKGDNLPVEIVKELSAGRYFIEIQAADEKDASDYSLRVSIK